MTHRDTADDSSEDIGASTYALSRRGFLGAGAAAAALALMPDGRAFGAAGSNVRLVPAPSQVPLLGAGAPATPVWAYNGGVPGPEIRLRQGTPLRVEVENGLGQDTTVHWHGLRLPNAMDGVPYVTQDPISPGE